jgi:antitoxin MazE
VVFSVVGIVGARRLIRFPRNVLTGRRRVLKLTYKYSSEQTMASAVLDIKQWGNNLGVRLPAAVAREAQLRVGQRVRVSVEQGVVLITPVAEAAPTLEQRLARFDPARHGGEAMVSQRIGAERW